MQCYSAVGSYILESFKAVIKHSNQCQSQLPLAVFIQNKSSLQGTVAALRCTDIPMNSAILSVLRQDEATGIELICRKRVIFECIRSLPEQLLQKILEAACSSGNAQDYSFQLLHCFVQNKIVPGAFKCVFSSQLNLPVQNVKNVLGYLRVVAENVVGEDMRALGRYF